MLSQRNILFWTAIIFFVFVAGLFYLTGGKRFEERKTVDYGESAPLESPLLHIPSNGSPVNVQEKSDNSVTVRYENGLFTPSEVTIKTETGCFVEVINASNSNIIPRLGPYDPTKEQGFLYSSITPHASGLIDPRYGVMHILSFYEKNDPAATFTVHIDPTCL